MLLGTTRAERGLAPEAWKGGRLQSGLTAKPTQERFNASAPVAGVLLEAMILKDGTSVPANYGARPVWEGDMLLVVKDEGINQANTPEEALRHISAMRPFIELPDLASAPSEKLDGTQLLATDGSGAVLAEGIGARRRVSVAGVVLVRRPQDPQTTCSSSRSKTKPRWQT
jgi:2-keto-4-pentenoate hydratase